MKTKAKGKQSPLKVVVIILAVIVVFVFAMAINTINDSSRGSSYNYDSRDYIYAAERGRYGELYSTTLRDMEKRTEYGTEIAECRALAFYYEQAVLEHAYRTAGNAEKADEFAKRMEEYESQLGSMSKKAEDVRKAVETERAGSQNDASGSKPA